MSKLFTMFFVLFFCLKSIGQDTANCRCKYYSSYSIRTYQFKIDSINKKLSEKYGKVMMVGFRGFSVANLLFIFSSQGKRKGIYYDLVSNKYKVVVGGMVSELAQKIESVRFALNKVNEIPSQYISHDVSYFISYDVSHGVEEICGSQLLTVRKGDIAKLFDYYMNAFKN